MKTLSEKLKQWRCERPDEWKMDEFIRYAEELEQECELLVHENADKDRRIAELEKQLKPSLFWDASDTEVSHDSIEELIHLRYEDGANVGDEIEIQRGVLLPNETYVITKIDDEDYSCEYELKGGAE